jgi:hypothetical protein
MCVSTAGPKAAAKNAVIGGVILAMIEGASVALTKVGMAVPIYVPAEQMDPVVWSSSAAFFTCQILRIAVNKYRGGCYSHFFFVCAVIKYFAPPSSTAEEMGPGRSSAPAPLKKSPNMLWYKAPRTSKRIVWIA